MLLFPTQRQGESIISTLGWCNNISRKPPFLDNSIAMALIHMAHWRTQKVESLGPLMRELTLSTPNLSAIRRQSFFYHDSSLLGFGLITVTYGESQVRLSARVQYVTSVLHRQVPAPFRGNNYREFMCAVRLEASSTRV